MGNWSAGIFIFLVAVAFAGEAVAYSWGHVDTLEDYITAWGTVGAPAVAGLRHAR